MTFLQKLKTRLLDYNDAYLVATNPRGNPIACLRVLQRMGFTPANAVDVGAHMCGWSRVLKRVFPHCRIVLVEPLDEMQGKIAAFCKEYPESAYVKGAVDRKPGEAYFTVRPQMLSASTFTASEADAEKHGWPRRLTRILTLDQVVREAGVNAPDLIKIDAEGCEIGILEGASDIWNSVEVIFAEASFFEEKPGTNNLLELIEVMRQRGFVPFDFTWFMREPTTKAVFLTEIAFVRKNGRFHR